MPNWCTNYLGVAGSYKDIQRLIENARGTQASNEQTTEEKLCFQKLYPAETSAELVPPDMTPAWYVDRLDKWGTKWEPEVFSPWTLLDGAADEAPDQSDMDQEDLERDFCATIRFDTAWSPPVELFDKVAKDYPQLTFRLRYFELGDGFKGVAEWRNGIRIKNEPSHWEAIDSMDWART